MALLAAQIQLLAQQAAKAGNVRHYATRALAITAGNNGDLSETTVCYVNDPALGSPEETGYYIWNDNTSSLIRAPDAYINYVTMTAADYHELCFTDALSEGQRFALTGWYSGLSYSMSGSVLYVTIDANGRTSKDGYVLMPNINGEFAKVCIAHLEATNGVYLLAEPEFRLTSFEDVRNNLVQTRTPISPYEIEWETIMYFPTRISAGNTIINSQLNWPDLQSLVFNGGDWCIEHNTFINATGGIALVDNTPRIYDNFVSSSAFAVTLGAGSSLFNNHLLAGSDLEISAGTGAQIDNNSLKVSSLAITAGTNLQMSSNVLSISAVQQLTAGNYTIVDSNTLDNFTSTLITMGASSQFSENNIYQSSISTLTLASSVSFNANHLQHVNIGGSHSLTTSYTSAKLTDVSFSVEDELDLFRPVSGNIYVHGQEWSNLTITETPVNTGNGYYRLGADSSSIGFLYASEILVSPTVACTVKRIILDGTTIQKRRIRLANTSYAVTFACGNTSDSLQNLMMPSTVTLTALTDWLEIVYDNNTGRWQYSDHAVVQHPGGGHSAVLEHAAAFFGDGSDGNVTINSSVTLTRSMYYNNLTVTSAGTLALAGFKVFVKETLTIDSGGVISRNGANGGNASGATGATGGSAGGTLVAADLGGSGAASAGATGTTGAGSSAVILTAAIGMGGNVGNCGSGGTGASGVGAVAGGALTTTYRPYRTVGTHILYGVTLLSGGSSGRGGASGGGDGTNSGGGGGGGGSGGGGVGIWARYIINNGSIQSFGGIGGDGGSPAAGNCGSGGGGAGGGGGYIYIVCITYIGNNPTCAGGAGGAPGAKTGTGTNGTAGTAGGAGRWMIYSYDLGTWSYDQS